MRKSTQTKGPTATAIAAKLTGDDAKRKTKLKPYKAVGRKPKKSFDVTDEEDEDAGFNAKEFDLGTDFFYDDDDDEDVFFDDNPFYN